MPLYLTAHDAFHLQVMDVCISVDGGCRDTELRLIVSTGMLVFHAMTGRFRFVKIAHPFFNKSMLGEENAGLVFY